MFYKIFVVYCNYTYVVGNDLCVVPKSLRVSEISYERAMHTMHIYDKYHLYDKIITMLVLMLTVWYNNHIGAIAKATAYRRILRLAKFHFAYVNIDGFVKMPLQASIFTHGKITT